MQVNTCGDQSKGSQFLPATLWDPVFKLVIKAMHKRLYPLSNPQSLHSLLSMTILFCMGISHYLMALHIPSMCKAIKEDSKPVVKSDFINWRPRCDHKPHMTNQLGHTFYSRVEYNEYKLFKPFREKVLYKSKWLFMLLPNTNLTSIPWRLSHC